MKTFTDLELKALIGEECKIQRKKEFQLMFSKKGLKDFLKAMDDELKNKYKIKQNGNK